MCYRCVLSGPDRLAIRRGQGPGLLSCCFVVVFFCYIAMKMFVCVWDACEAIDI